MWHILALAKGHDGPPSRVSFGTNDLPKLMATRSFNLGGWYESKGVVRRFFGEYWKGILTSPRHTAIVFNYRGARRVHYGDKLDFKAGNILYIGEGKRGDQVENQRNLALINASNATKAVDVFLDCGDLFKPKRLLYAGKWLVARYRYSALSRENSRKVFKFSLVPAEDKILDFLHFSFSALGRNPHFETDLERFAEARSRLYALHSDVIRSRDNISGEIGEYFAIKAFNKHAGRQHLIRLTGTFRDVDAIQVESGRRIAIKTVGAVPSNTSNIWSRDIGAAVDMFLICCLNRATLTPDFVASLTARQALDHLRTDRYQGAKKLQISTNLLRRARFLEGDRSHWT